MKKVKQQRPRTNRRMLARQPAGHGSHLAHQPDLDQAASVAEHNGSRLMNLQRTIGNLALQRTLARKLWKHGLPSGIPSGIPSNQVLMRQKTKDPKAGGKGAEAEAGKEETKKLSGASWVKEFPTSKEVGDLESGFSGHVSKFIKALEAAGASVTINATKRPPERAYLMHWAWKIAKQGYDPRKVPAKSGVNINWWHGDLKSSKQAAQEMVDSYGINRLKVAPSLRSHHILGKAIDMEISWSGDLKIKNAKGDEVLIKSSPKNHTNKDLISVAKTYSVIHYVNVAKDKVHWSVDGH